ncbi:MAG: PEP-CTERM sorting domain-containing protein [Burkholderiaceae bacterium]|nr:PEP-CTERM sorting domain-containing protein [Burkholderiaceae bacterium]
MKISSVSGALALMFATAASVQAAEVVYAGDLSPPAVQTGSAGGFSWFMDDGDGVEFWRLFATAGSTITLQVDRLEAGFDPALSIYSGLTSADTADFLSYGDWGGLSFIDYFDDENPASIPTGPAGDPFGSFVAPVTGFYTVAVGGSLSEEGGLYGYQITASVPEPETWALWGLGLAALTLRRRRRQD